MRSPAPLLCVLALAGGPRPGWGAQAPLLEPGTRVRVQAPGLGGRLTGTLVAWESDTLIVRVDGEGLGLIVPRDSVVRIDVEKGRRMIAEGVLLGGLAGALLALVASPESRDENGECDLPCHAYEVSPDLGKRVTILSLVGVVVGGIAGAGSEKRTWVPVDLDRVGVGPATGGGLALGVRISFE